MLSFKVEYLSTRLYNSSIVVSGSKDNEWKNGVDGAAPPEVLKDCIHAVNLHLLDIFPESPGEILYGFFFLFYYSMQRTNIPFLSYKTKVLGDEYSPEFAERIYRIARKPVEPS